MKQYKSYIRYIFISGLLFLWIILFSIPAGAAQPFELHLLDVGQGQSVLIEADGHYMLIDGGGRSSSSFVVSYLKQQGIDHLDLIAVSHYDEDHMSGLIGALSVFPDDELLLHWKAKQRWTMRRHWQVLDLVQPEQRSLLPPDRILWIRIL